MLFNCEVDSLRVSNNNYYNLICLYIYDNCIVAWPAEYHYDIIVTSGEKLYSLGLRTCAKRFSYQYNISGLARVGGHCKVELMTVIRRFNNE